MTHSQDRDGWPRSQTRRRTLSSEPRLYLPVGKILAIRAPRTPGGPRYVFTRAQRLDGRALLVFSDVPPQTGGFQCVNELVEHSHSGHDAASGGCAS